MFTYIELDCIIPTRSEQILGMADYNPERRDENTFEKPVFDDQGSYDPAEAWKYKDETNLQLQTQLIKLDVDDFYKYFEEKA